MSFLGLSQAFKKDCHLANRLPVLDAKVAATVGTQVVLSFNICNLGDGAAAAAKVTSVRIGVVGGSRGVP